MTLWPAAHRRERLGPAFSFFLNYRLCELSQHPNCGLAKSIFLNPEKKKKKFALNFIWDMPSVLLDHVAGVVLFCFLGHMIIIFSYATLLIGRLQHVIYPRWSFHVGYDSHHENIISCICVS